MRVLFSIVVFQCLLFNVQSSKAQEGYFQYPIYAGQKGTLAGVLGDLRPNHFHAGIDVRTNAREGLPVQASAGGYVSKIKIQTRGYGNVLFVKHPNGLTTVYGHLQRFNEEIAAYVRQEQYKKRSFEIDLSLNPEQFKVEKGELIAYSGNSGGSSGPHLHFEIRDSKDNFLNPLEYGFEEIEDDIPPIFQALALRPMTISSRINNEFERISTRPTKQKNGEYRISTPINVWGQVGLELMAFDYMNGVEFRNGVNCIEIKVDGNEIFAYNMSGFPNRITRDYNQLIDYETEQKQGIRYLKCYKPEGNVLDLYKTNQYQGKININDTLSHEVQITLFDSYENSSVLRFSLKGKVPENDPTISTQPITTAYYLLSEIAENILKIKAIGANLLPQTAFLFTKKNTVEIAPTYTATNEVVYLYDLRKNLPDSIKIGSKTLAFSFVKQIVPNKLESYSGNGFSVRFGNESIFDTLYLDIKKYPNGLKINDKYTPLRDAIEIAFSPESVIAKPNRTHVYLNDGRRLKFQGGKWRANNIYFSTRELGNFVLAVDTIPPTVNLRQANKKQIVATISDNLSGISTFDAYINNEWVLMNYDYKRALIWSDKQVDSLDFKGTVRIEATDQAGNKKILESEIKEIVVSTKKPVRLKKIIRPKKSK